MYQERKTKYSHIVANEGGFELNTMEAREAIVKVMCVFYELGKADAKTNFIKPDLRSEVFVNLVSNRISLHPMQEAKLMQCAPKWAELSYNDGCDSVE